MFNAALALGAAHVWLEMICPHDRYHLLSRNRYEFKPRHERLGHWRPVSDWAGHPTLRRLAARVGGVGFDLCLSPESSGAIDRVQLAVGGWHKEHVIGERRSSRDRPSNREIP